MTPQFCDFGERPSIHGMRNVWCPYSQSFILGRAADEDGGQEVRVHDMKKLWSPYDPPLKKFGQGIMFTSPSLFTFTENIIGHSGTTVSSCRGHGLPAHHHFRRPCPNYMTGNRAPQVPHSVDRLPPKSRNCGGGRLLRSYYHTLGTAGRSQ